MGNFASASTGSSQLTAGIRRAQNSENKLYQLIDLRGGGELVQWTKFAMKSGDNSILEGLIEVKVQPFLYGGGKGKLVAIADLVKMRNKERNATLGALQKKKGKGKSGPNILENVNQDEMQGDMMKALKLLDGGGKGKGGASKYREICWDIKQRGVLGETLLHLCLQNGTAVHNELAKRLILTYPKLVNDIYLSEEYYGQSALHQAIVNEDPSMVQFLLSHGADVHQRCYGAIFCCEDQRMSRTDSLEHEWVDLTSKTYYTGRAYWGEYPLSFAACVGQEECFRLLLAFKANVNMKDTNGNTVLHLTVLHSQQEMFDLACAAGAKLHIQNEQNLTPLTLAAKLGNKQMFEHVLKLERDVLWTYGGVICAQYPLEYIDTIDEKTGNTNTVSALALIVNEDTDRHIELLDGLVDDLLQEKWKAFAKKELLRSFLVYAIYIIVFFGGFLFRQSIQDESCGCMAAWHYNFCPYDELLNSSSEKHDNGITTHSSATIHKKRKRAAPTDSPTTTTPTAGAVLNGASNIEPINKTCQTNCTCTFPDCGLDYRKIFRTVFEILTVLGATWFIGNCCHMVRKLGYKTYAKSMFQFPEQVCAHASWVLVLLMVPIRFAAWLVTIGAASCSDAKKFDIMAKEHVFAIMGVWAATFNLLFFCRGVKFIALFIMMIFRIIRTDMMRFLLIFVVLCLGFSQGMLLRLKERPFKKFSWLKPDGEAFYVIFNRCKSKGQLLELISHYPNKSLTQILKDEHIEIMQLSILDSVYRTFIFTLGDPKYIFASIKECRLATMGKALVIVYQLAAQILMTNMLIASVTKAAEKLGEMRQNLWRRQWAVMILLLEQFLSPKARHLALLKYSRPIGTDKSKRAFVVRRDQTEDEENLDNDARNDDWKHFIDEKRAMLKRKLQQAK